MRCALLLLLLYSLAPAADLDHAAWDQLLKQYVNPQSRVDYRAWKDRGLKTLDTYLQALAHPWPDGMTANARKAALINAYNALTIRWILQNYPTASIWRTAKPFTAARHVLDGRKVSLDDIESQLRQMGDPRIHAALVCAARSCPPLRREAYTAERLDEQLDENVRAWLANPALNEFLPDRRVARISMIFKWYRQDFEKGGHTLEVFLARYAPPHAAAFLREGKVGIEHKTYEWGLNDASGLGRDYSPANFLWDRLRNAL